MLWIPIERSAARSLTRQIYEAMRARIMDGTLPGGALLPSTRELASNLHISRNVVLVAYEQLLAEGYIESRAGSGTYVAPGVCFAREDHTSQLSPILANSVLNANNPVIDFRSGLPALDLFPRKIWSQFVQRVYATAEPAAFGYDNPEGRLELRMALARYLQRTRGVSCQPEHILILSGASQAFSLLSRLLLAPNDEIVVEDPMHYEVQMILASSGMRLLPVPVDERGLQTHLLPHERSPRCIMVTPSHQFPLGGILSAPRRLQLLQFARAADCYVIEDDYDSEFRYTGSPISSLQGLDPQRVIYIGTFSKILSPALRLGYLVLPPELVAQARKVKRLLDLHSPSLEQLALAQFIETGHLERHIVRMKRIYQRRRNALIAQLQNHFAQQVRIIGDATGLHLTAHFSQVTFTPAIISTIEQAGARIYPVEQHAITSGQHTHEIILGYGHLSLAQIEQGVEHIKLALTSSS